MIGRTLSHYRIVEKLGEGGMGVVYKALDSHLDRPAAIKVLPRDRLSDADRLRRFVREARAASALNHPNIVHIYDIDRAEGTDFIAMEYVAGKTLAELVPRRGLRPSLALKYAVQVADALARAHAAGIVHRDVKPSNVMVDEHGLVKVVDFGLAKLGEAGGPEAETAAASTGTDTIVGTAAYMSPEQAEGKHVDTRSDIFSFGSLLYEMLTGQRAFRGDSRASTIAAILREEPKPISEVAEDLPRDAEKLVRRCLQKDPDRRFQHMDDVKIVLEELKEESDSGVAGAEATPARRRRRRFRVYVPVAAALMLIAAAAFYSSWRTSGQEAPLRVVPLTSYPGYQGAPSLSPDGREVAFSWDGPGQDNLDVYVQMVSGGPPQRLTTDPAPDSFPVWSPDGNQIAFLRGGFVYLISARGGAERRLCRALGSRIAWTPDGRSVAITVREDEGPPSIFLVSVESGQKRRMTWPPAKSSGDTSCAFSPDGRNLVFTRQPTTLGNDAYILPLADGMPKGEPWRLTNDSVWVFGLAWTPDSREIVFSSSRGGRRSLWRITPAPGAEPRRVPGTDDGRYPTISRLAHVRLAYQRFDPDPNIWRMEIPPSPTVNTPPTRIVASTAWERDPRFSPDGARIAFVSESSGYAEIWLAGADGSSPVQLTSFSGARTAGAPSWSPDGRQLVFDSMAGGDFDIFVVHLESRVSRQLTADGSFNVRPSWSRDGRRLYFGSRKSGSHQVWKIPAEGGSAEQVTKGGGLEAVEAPGGKFLYYTKSLGPTPGLWQVSVDGGAEVPVIDSVWTGHWAVTDRGIYFVDFSGVPAAAPKPVRFFGFEDRKVTRAGIIERIRLGDNNASFSVSRDGRWAIWRQDDRPESNTMLIDNFR